MNIFQQMSESKARQHRYPALTAINMVEVGVLFLLLRYSGTWLNRTYSTAFWHDNPRHAFVVVGIVLLSLLSIRAIHPLLCRLLRPWLPTDSRPMDHIIPQRLVTFEEWFRLLFVILWSYLMLHAVNGKPPF